MRIILLPISCFLVAAACVTASNSPLLKSKSPSTAHRTASAKAKGAGAIDMVDLAEGQNPFMFLLRSALNNPVTYLHSVLVSQLTILPCYQEADGAQYGVSNRTDMAWYRRLESAHNPRTFPSFSDDGGHLLILEPIIGYNWFLCDTAYAPKLQHAKKYEAFYKEFEMGRLSMDWNYYQGFSEFDRGQFKHHLFSNELSITEIFIYMNATLMKLNREIVFDMTQLTQPLEMGMLKLTLLRILESECSEHLDHYCESPTVDLIIPVFNSDGSITMQAKMKLYLANERLLKLGAETFQVNRQKAIERTTIRWTIEGQSIDLGSLGSLNPYPLTLTLKITTKPEVKSDCVGSGSYLSVKYDWQCVLCRPGYHLKNEPWVHPASETNSICHLCPVGTYSSTWGSVDCHNCPASHTTRKVGSTRSTDCLPLPRYAMESKIKELLTYFGIDESDEHKKGALLAIALMSPWVLFTVGLIVSQAYGHNEVRDSENRFQLEKELGTIILKIRRNYNVLFVEADRL